MSTVESGVRYDDLLGGGDGVPVRLANIKVAEDAEIERGMLLSASVVGGVYAPVNSSLAADDILVIAARDFDATPLQKTTQAYTSGVFNREKIILKSGLTIDMFEEALRHDDIILTSIK